MRRSCRKIQVVTFVTMCFKTAQRVFMGDRSSSPCASGTHEVLHDSAEQISPAVKEEGEIVPPTSPSMREGVERLYEGFDSVQEPFMDQLLVVKDIGSEQAYTQHVQLVKCDHDQSVEVVQQVHSSMGQAGKGFRLGNIVKHEKRGSDWWCQVTQVHWVGHSVKDITLESLAMMVVEYPD